MKINMTLKNKISFLISFIFSILFGIAVIVIYSLFADFRKEEFESRLRVKAIASIKLLVEVQAIDKQLLKVIDQNRLNKLYDEKTLIFDANFNLIYSSLDDTKINWSIDDLKYLKKNKTFFKKDGDYEIYGVFYDTNNEGSYALISASDNYGRRRLSYLIYILIFTYIVFTVICWLLTYYMIKKLLLPLVIFHNQIKNINENNLETRIAVKEDKDEIDLLANEFNQMLQRIAESYQKQKEFTDHASHELRTPIARITSQLENKIFSSETSTELRLFLKKILSDTNQVTELISSLLILSKLDTKQTEYNQSHRIDELIYDAIEKLNKNYPEFTIAFDIEFTDEMDSIIDIKGNKSLLEIAIINLLKNACIYSHNKQAKVCILQTQKSLKLRILNTGETLDAEEQKKLFQAFMRGNNAKGKTGLGLGLRIVQRILFQHNAKIIYEAPDSNTNIFTVIFKH